MRRLKPIQLLIIALVSLCLWGCKPQTPPMVSLGIDDVYRIQRLQAMSLHPAFEGASYRWTLTHPNGEKEVISTSRDLIFWASQVGTYYLTFEIIDPQTPYQYTTRIEVEKELIAYSPYISDVLEYRPAPGQFINSIPKWEAGMGEKEMAHAAFDMIGDQNKSLLSLGGFGGYVVYKFDHIVENKPGRDFFIAGNAFYSDVDKYKKKHGGSSEPGIVMVSFDDNLNGLADDTWYELAGSEYYKPQTIHNYSITYYKPDPNKTPVKDPNDPNVIDATYIRWTDNQGNEGYIPHNSFHSQPYYPEWIDADSYTLTGTKLANNAVDESHNGTMWVQYAFDWGYVDNKPVNKTDEENDFDISWAVDANGLPVHLKGISFVKVYTAENQVCGWLGETSTEFSESYDLHIKKEQEDSMIPPQV